MVSPKHLNKQKPYLMVRGEGEYVCVLLNRLSIDIVLFAGGEEEEEGGEDNGDDDNIKYNKLTMPGINHVLLSSYSHTERLSHSPTHSLYLSNTHTLPLSPTHAHTHTFISS